MGGAFRRAGILSIVVGITACSSISYKKIEGSDQVFCDGSRPKQKYTFMVATMHKIPTGLSVSQVSSFATQQERYNDFIVEHFVQSLFSLYFDTTKVGSDGNPTPVANDNLKAVVDTMFCDGGNCGGEVFDSVTWMGQNQFAVAVCGNKPCTGLSLPGMTFDKNGFINKMKYGYGTYIYGKGHGLLEFILDSGFNTGEFLATHYFSVPERDQTAVCKAAKLPNECYVFNDSDSIAKLRNELTESSEGRAHLPFLSHSKFMRESFDNIIHDNATRTEWQSALSIDLFFRAGTTVSKKMDGDWTINQITWDPTLFCKYAKTTSDFYTH